MACLGRILAHQYLRFRLELLCEVATSHSSDLVIYFTDIVLCYLGNGPFESAYSSGCSIRLCQFCEQYWLVSERYCFYRRPYQHQLRLRLPRLCHSPCRRNQSPRENGSYRHHGYCSHWIRHLMVLLHRPLFQHEQPQLVIFLTRYSPFHHVLGGRRPFPPPETCIVTLELSLKEAH